MDNRESLGAMTSNHVPPLSTDEAAAYLGTTKRHIDRLVFERRVTYLKLGGKRRFLISDLEDYLAESRVERQN